MNENQNQNQETAVTISPELQLLNAKNAGAYNLTPAGQMYNQFVVIQRMGQMYSGSTIIPDRFKNNIGDCVIAIDMAQRMGANPLMVMQNLYVVYGNPSFSSKFLIATINASGKFTSLRYEFTGEQGKESWGCRCFAYETSDRNHQEPLYGDWITISMAKAEGWFDKKMSKWQTMPGQMLRYRAAAFWQRIYCPEISMGLTTKEEIEDGFIVNEEKKDISKLAQDAAIASQPASKTETDKEQQTNQPEGGKARKSLI